MNHYKNANGKSGQSIVSVLISLAISGIVITVMLQISSEQNKSLKHFTQKSDVLEVRNIISEQLSDPQFCDWQFSKNNTVKINTSNIANAKITFNNIHLGKNATSPTIIAVNDKLSGLKVNSIEYTDLVAVGATGKYQGNLEISFDPSTAARSIAPLKIKKFILVDMTDPANARSVLGCSSTNSITSIQSICRVKSMASTTSGIQTVCCAPDEVAVAGQAPLDKDFKIGWAVDSSGNVVNERCMVVDQVGTAPDKIQLRCCK